jgi:tRNA(Ile)-lysidine synthetase-like protein
MMQEGDAFQPLGMKESKKLSKFKDEKLSLIERATLDFMVETK